MRKLLLIIAALGGLTAGLATFLWTIGDLSCYRVQTAVMKPTLVPNDQFWVEGFSYRFRKPNRGEIVVFRTTGILGISQPDPPEPSPLYVMRIIGLPGDKIRLHHETLLVNDKEDLTLRSIRLIFTP